MVSIDPAIAAIEENTAQESLEAESELPDG